ncbi:MAG: flippase [Bacteroidetes bacterium]|nr:flippase [Bacteroidota bacterium]
MDNNDNIETKINFKSDTFKKYFKNTSWLFAEKILRLLISFVVTVLVVRYLGPKQFGLLSYAISFYGLFSAISILGLESISIRELVKYPERRDNILGSVFLLRLVGGIVTIIFIALTLFISGEPTDISILILIISTSAIFQSFSVIDYYFRAEVKAKYSVYVMTASVLFTSSLKILLIILEAPLIYFAIVFSVEFFVAAAGFLLVYKHNKLKIINWKFRKETAMNLLKDSWPLILSGLVIAIYTKIDQVMIKNMLDSKELGYYAAAVRLSEAWYFIPVALTNSIFPAIINAKKVSNKFYFNRMQKLYDILAWMAIAIAVPVSIFSKDIINIIFGNEFQSAAPVLTIYIWAGVAVFLGVASSQYLITENFTKLSFFRTFIGMIFNVILNLILIPKYGIVGAAVATLVSYSVATFSLIFISKTSLQIKMMLKSIFLITFIQYLFEKWNKHLEKK